MLLAFPIELRSQIAEYLSPEDARNLRLVCKELLPVGNAVAFRTWKLWHRKESTKKFAEFVAKGGSLLVCVEELVIDTSRFSMRLNDPNSFTCPFLRQAAQ